MDERLRVAPVRRILEIERRETRLASCGVHVRLDPPPRARGDKANREITFRGRRAALDVRRGAGREIARPQPRDHRPESEGPGRLPFERALETLHTCRRHVRAYEDGVGRGGHEDGAAGRLLHDRLPAQQQTHRPCWKNQRLLLDVVVNGVAEDRQLRAELARAVPHDDIVGEAVFRPDLFHGVTRGDRRPARRRPDGGTEPRHVERRHLEARAGQTEGAEIGDVRSAVAAAHVQRDVPSVTGRRHDACPEGRVRVPQVIVGPQWGAVHERAVSGARFVSHRVHAHTAVHAQPVGNGIIERLSVAAAMAVARAVGHAPSACAAGARHRVQRGRWGIHTLDVHVAAELKRLAG